MNQDTDDILKELEQALWEEEAAEEAQDFPREEPTEDLLTESVVGDGLVYRNFSNNYGADLRNFASGYRARNTDRTDVDFEEYAEAVAEGEKTGSVWLPLLTVVLEAIAVAYMVVTIFGGLS